MSGRVRVVVDDDSSPPRPPRAGPLPLRLREDSSEFTARPHGSKTAFMRALFCVCAGASRANLSCPVPSAARWGRRVGWAGTGRAAVSALGSAASTGTEASKKPHPDG